MVSEPAKVTLPLTLLGFAAAVVYGLVGGDDTGLWLFAGLSAVASIATLVLLPARPVDRVAVTPGGAAVRDAVAPGPAGAGAWPLLAAIGATFVGVALVYGTGWAIAGALLVAAAGLGWVAQVAADRRGATVEIGPLSIPVLAAVAIGSIMFFLSRILLAVSPHGATALAIVAAAGVLVVAVLLAFRMNSLGSGALVGVLVLGVAAVVVAGISGLASGERTEEKAKGAVEGPNAAVVAKGTRFDTTTLALAAGRHESLRFVNRDTGTFHNVAIYRDKDYTKALFNGTPINHGSVDYETPTLDPGTYYFHCDFHPAMQGTVDVK